MEQRAASIVRRDEPGSLEHLAAFLRGTLDLIEEIQASRDARVKELGMTVLRRSGFMRSLLRSRKGI
jgi:hypothetical protein